MTPHKIYLLGSNEAQCGDVKVTSPQKVGVIAPLCRELIKQGADPTDLVSVWRGETPVFGPLELKWWADRQVIESDRFGVQVRKYKPFEKAANIFRGGQDEL